MTAEIAILNANAVAVAADSAVTIGRGKKIYNSAIKVFSLSKVAPVGIMVYGNAGLLDVPWETTIKIYRQELRQRTFSRLEEYAEHFLAFLPKQTQLFSADAQELWKKANILGYFAVIRDDIVRAVENHIKEHRSIDDAGTAAQVKSAVIKHHDRLKKSQILSGLSKSWEAQCRRKLRSRVKEFIAEIFQKLPLDADASSKLLNVATWILTRCLFSDAHSGIVICGFGNSDVFPVVSTHLVDGVFDGRLKVTASADKSYRIRRGTDCSIIPFAQDDMVASFMEGLNPSVNVFTHRWLRDVFQRLPELISSNDLSGGAARQRKSRARFGKAASALLEGFFKQLQVHKRQEHIDPILSMVRVLPKDELAAMAEALVNLTAFKRRMTEELETVGGPIDVAVISKGDGLVWVKRKHYFEPALNQHFFANYFRGIANG